jgi:hypothetical protein
MKFKVKGWEEFQHYKDRNPPWIKLHNQLLDDYDFEVLGDAAKGHLLCIWMLASRTNNDMMFDSKWIARKIGASSKVDLDLLLESGFIELQEAEHSASKLQHDSKVSVPLEEKRRGETETEKRREEKKASAFNFTQWDSTPSDLVLSEWTKHRTKKKATTSQLVIDRMAKEINEAFKDGYSADDCLSEAIVRGWTGMKAEWIKNSQASKSALHNLSNKDYSQHEGAL